MRRELPTRKCPVTIPQIFGSGRLAATREATIIEEPTTSQIPHSRLKAVREPKPHAELCFKAHCFPELRHRRASVPVRGLKAEQNKLLDTL